MTNAEIIQCSLIKSASKARIAGNLLGAGKRFAGRAFSSGLHNAAATQAKYMSAPLSGISRVGLSKAKSRGARQFFTGMQNVGDRMSNFGLYHKNIAKNTMGAAPFRGGNWNPANLGRNIAGDWVNQSLLWGPLYGMAAGGIYSGVTGREAPQAPGWLNQVSKAYSAPFSVSSPTMFGLTVASKLLGG